MPRDKYVSGQHTKDRHRLRFKRPRARTRTQSPPPPRSRSAGVATSEQLDPDDEAFYGTGPLHSAEPSLLANIEPDNFVEHLFDALADDEGRDYWETFYDQPVSDSIAAQEMTDDEYVAYIRRGMWEKRHGNRARAKQNVSSEADQESQQKQKAQSQFRNIPAVSLHNREQLDMRWKTYLKSWQELGSGQLTVKTIPWPTMKASIDSLNGANVTEFLASAGDVSLIAREELRRRWHPDRFAQKAIKHVVSADHKQVLTAVTLVAQILNDIISG